MKVTPNCLSCSHWGVSHLTIMRDDYEACARTVGEAKGFLDKDEIYCVTWPDGWKLNQTEEGKEPNITIVTHKTFYCSRWERK